MTLETQAQESVKLLLQIDAVALLFEAAYGSRPWSVKCDERYITAAAKDETSFASLCRQTGEAGLADIEQGCWSFDSIAEAMELAKEI